MRWAITYKDSDGEQITVLYVNRFSDTGITGDSVDEWLPVFIPWKKIIKLERMM